MATLMQLVGLVQGPKTMHDGRYLVEYDPHKRTTNIIGAHLVTTDDPAKARVFADAAELQECWAESRGTRAHDGKPDRPLTAFSITTAPTPTEGGKDATD